MFTLLHTNDFHNSLDSVQAGYLRRMRATLGPRGLLLDAGDAVASGNVTFRPSGEMILKIMSDAGYDALTVGNREFHFWEYGFRCKIKLARFPILCANLRPAQAQVRPKSESEISAAFDIKTTDAAIKGTSSGKQQNSKNPSVIPFFASSPFLPYIVRDLYDAGETLRILILGLTVPMITERMLARKVSAYVFDDPIAIAARLVPFLKAQYKPDLLVALTHIGIGQDRKLAHDVPGIDLIIGGHTHVVLEQGERMGDTLIVQAGSHGKFTGRVDIDFASKVQYSSKLSLCLRATLLPLPKRPTEAQMLAQLESLGQSRQTESELKGEARS